MQSIVSFSTWPDVWLYVSDITLMFVLHKKCINTHKICKIWQYEVQKHSICAD